MEVEELKQVVDSNAVEMREGFAKVDARFEKVDERFDKLERRIETFEEGIRRHFDVVIERVIKSFDTLAEAVLHIDAKVDRKCAELEERLTHKFGKR